MKTKIEKKKVDEFMKMLKSWLDADIVRATTNFVYIENRNEAFARGYRDALYSVLRKAEEAFNENYTI